jgi:two-component system copper resistance phosphate regulon response regulator CusR
MQLSGFMVSKLAPMKILVVEDEQKTARYLKKGLEEQGFAVDVASDGEEGLFLARESEHDLIILDVMLPKMDGLTLLSELRNQGRSTLALFLSAQQTVDDRVKGLNMGGDAYMVKPFAFSELLAQVKTLLRRTPQRAANRIQVSDLEIDIDRRIAWRSGQKLELTAKEFSLLLLLARRQGEILSRTLISEQVWDIHFDSGSNVVDVHIRRLRSKVDDPFEVKLIKTVRGMGYILLA